MPIQDNLPFGIVNQFSTCGTPHEHKPFPEVIEMSPFGYVLIEKVCARLIKQGHTISLYNKTILIHGVNNG